MQQPEDNMRSHGVFYLEVEEMSGSLVSQLAALRLAPPLDTLRSDMAAALQSYGRGIWVTRGESFSHRTS